MLKLGSLHGLRVSKPKIAGQNGHDGRLSLERLPGKENEIVDSNSSLKFRGANTDRTTKRLTFDNETEICEVLTSARKEVLPKPPVWAVQL
jgi:hypothetical protein